MDLRILHLDEKIVVVQKPRGLAVHPHTDPRFRGNPHRTALHVLGKQIGKYLYPVHRLDQATEGVLIFALDTESARVLAEQFRTYEVQKRYLAVSRGWITEPLRLDHKLKSDESDALLESVTEFQPLSHLELPFASSRYPSSRFTMLEANPQSGRYHQIRRHLAHLSHPIVGDSIYGEGHCNRTFKAFIQAEGLWLMAHRLSIKHPESGEKMIFTARFGSRWHRLFDAFGMCPF